MTTRTVTKAIATPLPTSNKAWNAKTRHIIRESLGYVCATCGLESDWSDRCPEWARLEIGHIVARSLTNDNRATNLIAQCFTCNRDAANQGMLDLTNDVIPSLTIRAFLPGPLCAERVAHYGKHRDREPLSGMASQNARRNAREARGLVW